MVKQVDIQAEVVGCNAVRFAELLYEGEAVKDYHMALFQDSNCEVSPWENGVRLVTFSMPLSMPDFVKRMVGLDTVRVCERQTLVWHSSSKFSVASETTVLNMPGTSQFNTSLLLGVTDGDSDSTGASAAAVDCLFSVKVSAAVPWPMSVSIENVMCEQAKGSMQKLLQFATMLVAAGGAGSASPPHSVDILDAVEAGLACAVSLSRRRVPSQTITMCSTTYSAENLMPPPRPTSSGGPAPAPAEGAEAGPLPTLLWADAPDLALPGGLSSARSETDAFQDANDHWSLPFSGGSWSAGTSSSGDWGRAVDQAAAARHASLMPGQLPVPAVAADSVACDAPDATSLHALASSVQSLAASVQAMSSKLDSVMERLGTAQPAPQSAAQRGTRRGSSPWTVLRPLLLLLAITALLGLLYWQVAQHRTGLLPRPPAAPSPEVEVHLSLAGDRLEQVTQWVSRRMLHLAVGRPAGV